MGKVHLGRRVASGGARVWTPRRLARMRSARVTSQRGGALAWNVLLNPCLSMFFSKNLY
jgi:hypothetical protein